MPSDIFAPASSQGGGFNHKFIVDRGKTWTTTTVYFPIQYTTKNMYCSGEFSLGIGDYYLSKTAEYYTNRYFNFVASIGNPSVKDLDVKYISVGV